MASLLNMSGGSLLSKGLPYDAEIEYLEATGTQWIFTDVHPGDTIGISCEVMWDAFNNEVYESSFCGSKYNVMIRFYAPCVYGSKFAYGWNSWLETNIVAETMHKYSIQYNYMNNRKMIIDGIERVSLNGTLPAFSSGGNLSIFSSNYNEIQGVALKGKIYRLTISDNTAIIHDYIPVRVGNVGYMYDKVSGKLFGNQGTGSFILGPDKHKEFVDLGLPSGTLWAEGNIIKNNKGNYSIGKPTDKGCYFSWGNIDGHNKGEEYNFSQDIYNTTPGATLTGNISPTDAEHDAAVARIGEWCHIPTKDQFVELCNSEYTDITGTSRDGVEGLLITSRINGNSIFLPDAGLYNGTSLYANGTYWSSTFSNEATAYYLFFFSGTTSPTNTVYRCWGLTVRPVIS